MEFETCNKTRIIWSFFIYIIRVLHCLQQRLLLSQVKIQADFGNLNVWAC